MSTPLTKVKADNGNNMEAGWRPSNKMDLLLEHLLEVKDSQTAVLDELTWDNLPQCKRKLVECVCKLLKTFAMYTSLISGEEYTTISSALPILMVLNLHLDNKKNVLDVADTSCLLQSELN